MHEIFYDKLTAHFREKIIQSRYMDTDSFALNVNTKNTIKDLLNQEDLFDLSNWNDNHEIFGNKSKTVIVKFTVETPEKI